MFNESSPNSTGIATFYAACHRGAEWLPSFGTNGPRFGSRSMASRRFKAFFRAGCWGSATPHPRFVVRGPRQSPQMTAKCTKFGCCNMARIMRRAQTRGGARCCPRFRWQYRTAAARSPWQSTFLLHCVLRAMRPSAPTYGRASCRRAMTMRNRDTTRYRQRHPECD